MTSTFEIIEETAKRLGATAKEIEYLKAAAKVESGGRANAKNPYSSATGLFQFISSTGAQYGLGPHNIYDPVAQTKAALAFTRDNAAVLKTVLNGKDPTAGDLYLAHFLGAGGAKKVLAAAEANPNQSAASIVGPAVVGANASIRFRGKSFAEFTAQDLRDWAIAKVDGNYYVDAQQRGDIAAGREYGRKLLKANGVPDAVIDMLMNQDPFVGFILQLIMGIIGEMTPPSERPGAPEPMQQLQGYFPQTALPEFNLPSPITPRLPGGFGLSP